MTSSATTAPADTRETVLIVDDSPDVLTIISELLKQDYHLTQQVPRQPCLTHHRRITMKRVLIVDDHPVIRKMIRLALRDQYVLDEAGDAESAYARILDNVPDGIILDVMMPGSMNGFQLCDRIKKDAGLAAMHVVLVTACGQVEDQELGRSLGADAYFVKPFSPMALARHLNMALYPVADSPDTHE